MAILSSDGVTVLSSESPTTDEIKKGLDFRTDGEWPFYVPHPSSLGRMSFKMLRTVYELSSSVRPAVDSITREVSFLPWNIVHKDLKYHPPGETEEFIQFFRHVNNDNEDISIVLSRFINDLLIVGRGTIEKVKNPFQKTIELVARDASLFQPIYDKDIGIIGYQEYERNSFKKLRIHRKEDIIFRYFTPVTYTAGSLPIIETVVNEIALLMLTVKSIAWAFTHDEIPPGILHLGQIGEAAIERAKASFEAARGEVGKNKLRVIDNVEKVQWVQLSRPFHEMQVAELIPIIERIISRNFGLAPVESGLSDVSHGTADVSVKQSQSKLIMPLISMVANILNHQVIQEFNPNLVFKYIDSPQSNFTEKTTAYNTLWRAGIYSRNEIRLRLGDPAIQGGDIYTVLLGNEVAPIDEKTGLPIYRNPAVGQPGENKPKLESESEDIASLSLTDAEFNDIFDLDGSDEKKKT